MVIWWVFLHWVMNFLNVRSPFQTDSLKRDKNKKKNNIYINQNSITNRFHCRFHAFIYFDVGTFHHTFRHFFERFSNRCLTVFAIPISAMFPFTQCLHTLFCQGIDANPCIFMTILNKKTGFSKKKCLPIKEKLKLFSFPKLSSIVMIMSGLIVDALSAPSVRTKTSNWTSFESK